MALQTLPTFTPSGYLQFSTALPAFPQNTGNGIAYTNPFSVATAVALPAGSAPDKVLIQNMGPEDVMLLLAAAAATTTATADAGATAIVVASATSIAVGQVVVGAGLAPGTFVVSISGTTITISMPTTAALVTTAVNFVTAVTLSSGIAALTRVPLSLAYVSSGFICAISMNPSRGSTLNVSIGV